MNKFLERLKLLETYSQELLKTDAKISQSEDLIQFFRAQTQDLDPCFPEDSVVIMPSEIGGEKKKQVQQQLSITHPQASQSYRCIETFETKDTKNQAFKVAQKEIVEVLLKDMTGWWLVENADKQLAWFPASYLEEIDIHEDIQDALSSNEEGNLYFVMRAYESQKVDELSLNSGVVVEVVRKSDNGWWLIRYNGRTGYMPSMCLQPYKNPHHRLQTIMNCGLNISTPNLCSSPPAPQPQGKARGGSMVQDHASQDRSDEDSELFEKQIEIHAGPGVGQLLAQLGQRAELEARLVTVSARGGAGQEPPPGGTPRPRTAANLHTSPTRTGTILAL
ncbi:LOW QUALITY PROTEIN: NADPH oxidase organizer 1 [Cygnus atratus]|uniref:LOW QUALITY PROTEIN: NADPH oxidase organizer 1 n=1 Tax=Cygnus atratus TaxID=8868 RepID=UPI0021B6FBBF|nr:LOW QUALITY PROTEIN: NADPH oxidase organizer 1 [Cygnus atratus]